MIELSLYKMTWVSEADGNTQRHLFPQVGLSRIKPPAQTIIQKVFIHAATSMHTGYVNKHAPHSFRMQSNKTWTITNPREDITHRTTATRVCLAYFIDTRTAVA